MHLGSDLLAAPLAFSSALVDRWFSTVGESLRLQAGPGAALATPHRVARDCATLRLLDYSTDDAAGLPVLVHAPFAGHTAAIADFHRHQSLMRCLQQYRGGPLYMTEWKSATAETKGFGIDRYLDELLACIDLVGGRAHLVGLCQGGWACAMLAALPPEKIASLVLAGAPLDLSAGDGPIRKTVDGMPFAVFEGLVALGGGVMPGAFMLQGFKAMHPFQQYVGRYLDLYEHVDEPDYRERLESFSAWFDHPLDLPGRWYLQVVRDLFVENRFFRGTFTSHGRTIGLADVICPTFLLAGEHDEITPPAQVLNARGRLGTPLSRVATQVVPGGHVGLFMSHRSVDHVWPAIAGWIRDQDGYSRTSSREQA